MRAWALHAWVLLLADILCAAGMNMCFIWFSHCDNNLEAAMVEDVNELLRNTKVTADSSMNVWLMQDRHSEYVTTPLDGFDREYQGAMIYKYSHSQNRLQINENLGERNVDDPGLLRMFIARALNDCKSSGSDKYALVLSNHGAGWYGFGGDEETGERRLAASENDADGVSESRRLSGGMLTLHGIRTAVTLALSDAGLPKLDLFGFDACLMASYSALAAFHDLADYYVASEATEPGHGWNYYAVDPSLSDIPAFTAAIIDEFSLGKHGYWSHQNPKTLAMYDMSTFPDFKTKARALFQTMITALRDRGDSTLSLAITRARSSTSEFMGVVEETDTKGIADLGMFLQMLRQQCNIAGISDVIGALAQLTAYFRQSPDTPSASGTGVFFPQKRNVQRYGQKVYPTWYYESRTDSLIELWNDFIAAYYSFQGSNAGGTTVCDGGAVPVPTPPPPAPDGVRVTHKGCACQKDWEMRGHSSCSNYCCNPDDDAGGEWCFVESATCEGHDWGYCRAASPSPPPSPASGPSPSPASEAGSCVDSANPPFNLEGNPAACSQLQDFCSHAEYGQDVRRACPVTCEACCVTMVGHGSVAPAGSTCESSPCVYQTGYGQYGWCWTNQAQDIWGSCALACWPDGLPDTTLAPDVTRTSTEAPVTLPPQTITTTSPGPEACVCQDVEHNTMGTVVGCGDHVNDGEPWCYVLSSAVCDPPSAPSTSVDGHSWIYCNASGGGAQTTTTRPLTTTTGGPEELPLSCQDKSSTNFDLNGAAAMCSQLRDFCVHQDHGADIIRECPETCGECHCSDHPTYADSQGSGCSDWHGRDCFQARDTFGFTQAQEEDLIRYCRQTCSACGESQAMGDDSCEYETDGECDEPRYCDVGTDCTDCGNCQAIGGSAVQQGTTSTLPPQPAGMWKIHQGPCTIEGGCIFSPNFPQEYGSGQRCEILAGASVGTISAVEFETEADYDELVVNDRKYSGRQGPTTVAATGIIIWSTDASHAQNGWKICADSSSTNSSATYDNSCRFAFDQECDLPPVCHRDTDCTDCGTCSLTQPPTTTTEPRAGGLGSIVDNSCVWSRDGRCDEGDKCRPGTDCTDCSSCSKPGASDDACQYANDGHCDEPLHCWPGYDCSDCNNCASPPEGCTCIGVAAFAPRCGDLAFKGDEPWCYVENSPSCKDKTSSWTMVGYHWVNCVDSPPGGYKSGEARWHTPAGCSCVKGHPVASNCRQNSQSDDAPWCYANGDCPGMQSNWLGDWVYCISEDGSSMVTATASQLVPNEERLLWDIHVAWSAEGYGINVTIAPEVAQVELHVHLTFRKNGQKAVTFTSLLQGSFAGSDRFESFWNGEVPYLSQGSTTARAKFQPEGGSAMSLPCLYYSRGVVPRLVEGLYAHTGGVEARLVFGANHSEPPALYVENPENVPGRGMLSAIGREQGGLIGPIQEVILGGQGVVVVDTLLAWGYPPEAPQITLKTFAVRGNPDPPIPFEAAMLNVNADRDPPRGNQWEDQRQVAFDGRGNISREELVPCTAHTGCQEEEYCWDCYKCRNSGSTEFCLDCAKGAFCGKRKWCNCFRGGTVCDSIDDRCPGEAWDSKGADVDAALRRFGGGGGAMAVVTTFASLLGVSSARS